MDVLGSTPSEESLVPLIWGQQYSESSVIYQGIVPELENLDNDQIFYHGGMYLESSVFNLGEKTFFRILEEGHWWVEVGSRSLLSFPLDGKKASGWEYEKHRDPASPRVRYS